MGTLLGMLRDGTKVEMPAACGSFGTMGREDVLWEDLRNGNIMGPGRCLRWRSSVLALSRRGPT